MRSPATAAHEACSWEPADMAWRGVPQRASPALGPHHRFLSSPTLVPPLPPTL